MKYRSLVLLWLLFVLFHSSGCVRESTSSDGTYTVAYGYWVPFLATFIAALLALMGWACFVVLGQSIGKTFANESNSGNDENAVSDWPWFIARIVMFLVLLIPLNIPINFALVHGFVNPHRFHFSAGPWYYPTTLEIKIDDIVELAESTERKEVTGRWGRKRIVEEKYWVLSLVDGTKIRQSQGATIPDKLYSALDEVLKNDGFR
jgi:hypothetical protein